MSKTEYRESKKMKTNAKACWIGAIVFLLGITSAQAQTPPFQRTVIVPSTGNPTADGTALISALASLSPAPSGVNRWLIKLEPGIYDVGTSPVVGREYVDLEGSGATTTTIRGSVAPTPPSVLGGLVQAADNSEIRFLGIHCTSRTAGASCQAISIDSASPRLTGIFVQVDDNEGSGDHWGIRVLDGGPILDDVEVWANADNSQSSNYAIVYSGSSRVTIKRSIIVAQNAPLTNWAIALENGNSGGTIRETEIIGYDGHSAAGVMYLNSASDGFLLLYEPSIRASTTSGISYGIGSDPVFDLQNQLIRIRGGHVNGGHNGVAAPGASIKASNSEIAGSQKIVHGETVQIYSAYLHGSGTVTGGMTTCAGIVDNAGTFHPNSCP